MSVFKLFLSKDSIEFGNEKYNQVFICGEWYSKKVKQTMKLTLLEVFQVDKISIIVFDEIQAVFNGNKVFYRNPILWEVCKKNSILKVLLLIIWWKLLNSILITTLSKSLQVSYGCFTKELQKHNKCSMRLNFLFSCIIFRLLL